ncbi:MAG TPA: hypothetical protein VHL58_08160 [Thermoanaerobaculia bacterium]|nr:hypothetical protein [Thermoanaerobaculia bacterium]
MCRALSTILLVAALSSPAAAAVRYEFHQTIQSNFKGIPSSDITARAVIDGQRSRVDFLSGSPYGPGSYVINAGEKTMYIVQPDRKTYTVIDIPTQADPLQSAAPKIQISNDKIELNKLADHPIYAGLPTDHYRLDTSYDITVTLGSVSLRQTVRTAIEKWTTPSFADALASVLGTSVPHTGNVKLDALIDAEATRIKGLPLRQITTITTLGDQRNFSSELRIDPRRQQISEVTISSIEEVAVPPTTFQIPGDYKKADLSKEEKGTEQGNVHILNMEPATSTQ